MDYGTLHSIATVAAIIAFGAVCWWAYRPANRQRFEEDARMVLDTDPILSRAASARATKTSDRRAQTGEHSE